MDNPDCCVTSPHSTYHLLLPWLQYHYRMLYLITFPWLPHIAEGIIIGSSSLLQYVALQWCHVKDVGTSSSCAMPYNLMNLMHLMLL